MSTHAIPVIEITEVLTHPNADSLDIVPVGGWHCVVKKDSFKVGDKAVYIEPDYMVPVTLPEFEFLKDPSKFGQTHARIKAKRLRGHMSYGLLIPAPDVISHIDHMGVRNRWRVRLGMNLMEHYGITRWEPPIRGNTVANELGHDKHPALPKGLGKFDLENINNFSNIIEEGEDVVITEKVHGANARFVWWNDEMFVGSRTRWLQRNPEKSDAWHMSLDMYPAITDFCKAHPGTILYGEVFGNVQDLTYGRNGVDFAAFAAFDATTGDWWDTLSLMVTTGDYTIPQVPVLHIGQFSRQIMEALAEGDSLVPKVPLGHMREGVVVSPIKERIHPKIGRVSLKYVSGRYFSRKL